MEEGSWSQCSHQTRCLSLTSSFWGPPPPPHLCPLPQPPPPSADTQVTLSNLRFHLTQKGLYSHLRGTCSGVLSAKIREDPPKDSSG